MARMLENVQIYGIKQHTLKQPIGQKKKGITREMRKYLDKRK